MKLLNKLTLFSILMMSQVSMAGADSCQKILQNVTATIDFISYIDNLLKNRIIDDDQLEQFYFTLFDGKLINPIRHQKTSVGPVFINSTDRIHYFQFQKFINEFNKNPQYLNLSEIIKRTKIVLEQMGVEISQKVKAAEAAQIPMLMDKISKSPNISKLFWETDFATIFRILPKTSREFAMSLFLSEDNDTSIAGFKYLSNFNRPFSYVEIEAILESKPYLIYYIEYFIVDDKSPEFTKFLKMILNSDYPSYVLGLVIEKIKYLDDEEIISKLKDYVTSPFTNLAKASIEALRKSGRKEIYSFLLKNAQDFNIDIMTREKMIEVLLEDGFTSSILSPKQIQKFGYMTYAAVTTFAGRQDSHSLKLIEMALSSKDDQLVEAGKKALIGRNDPASLELVKNFIIQGQEQRQNIYDYMNLLSGRDDSWSLNLIEKMAASKDLMEKVYAYYLLNHSKNSESLALILKLYFKDQDKFEKQKLIGALSNHSVEDLLLVVDKYMDTGYLDLAFGAFIYLRGKSDPRILQWAEKMSQSNDYRKIELAFLHFESLPLTFGESFFLNILRDPKASKSYQIRAIRKFIGIKNAEVKEVTERLLMSSNLETEEKRILRAQYVSYLFQINEDFLSESERKQQDAVNEFKKLKLELFNQLNEL